jgi:hypothetical protein
MGWFVDPSHELANNQQIPSLAIQGVYTQPSRKGAVKLIVRTDVQRSVHNGRRGRDQSVLRERGPIRWAETISTSASSIGQNIGGILANVNHSIGDNGTTQQSSYKLVSLTNPIQRCRLWEVAVSEITRGAPKPAPLCSLRPLVRSRTCAARSSVDLRVARSS